MHLGSVFMVRRLFLVLCDTTPIGSATRKADHAPHDRRIYVTLSSPIVFSDQRAVRESNPFRARLECTPPRPSGARPSVSTCVYYSTLEQHDASGAVCGLCLSHVIGGKM